MHGRIKDFDLNSQNLDQIKSELGIIPLAAIEMFKQAQEIENMSDLPNSEKSVKADTSEDGPQRNFGSLLP